MKISRHFSQDGQSPYAGIDFDARVSEIKNPDGSTVFRQEEIAVPQAWSAVATDILAQKYFRKSGVPLTGPGGASAGRLKVTRVLLPKSLLFLIINTPAARLHRYNGRRGYG